MNDLSRSSWPSGAYGRYFFLPRSIITALLSLRNRIRLQCCITRNKVKSTYSQNFIYSTYLLYIPWLVTSRIYKTHRLPHSMVVPGSLWIREESISPPREPDRLLESQKHIEDKGLSQAQRMSRPSDAPRLTPQYCFNERALRGQCLFLRPQIFSKP